VNAFLQELFHVGIYKRNQGRIARQVTFAAVAVVLAMGLWRLSQTLIEWGIVVRYSVPGALLLLGLWATYRAVNVPVFADFLIAVEAEMNKVSWPTRSELIRGSSVVLIVILALAAALFGFDLAWKWIFQDVLRIL